MLRRFTRDVVSAKPTHVIIMGGSNDVLTRETFPRITFNLERLIKDSLEHNIQPILGLPIPLGWDEPEVRLARVRNWLTNYALDQNLKVIDFAKGFYQLNPEGVPVLRWELMLDGSHPTIEGYETMADQFDFKQLGLVPSDEMVKVKE
jgi:lysophospholipase L1-like esterase